MSAEEFSAACDVSRETTEKLQTYLDLLLRWQKRINLVGPSTLHDPWRRHMLDSAQLFPALPAGARRLADIGSGAGFPGLVLAILGAPDVQLVESDSRKCAFLREAARVCEADVTIHNHRIESLGPLGADIVTARALAPLSDLIRYASEIISENGICLFLKGREVNQELTDTVKERITVLDQFPSRSDQEGQVLILGFRKADGQ